MLQVAYIPLIYFVLLGCGTMWVTGTLVAKRGGDYTQRKREGGRGVAVSSRNSSRMNKGRAGMGFLFCSENRGIMEVQGASADSRVGVRWKRTLAGLNKAVLNWRD
ncbi:uncharacterized protein B0H64DRAFT_389663, partial [Chaetomium fimeti]